MSEDIYVTTVNEVDMTADDSGVNNGNKEIFRYWLSTLCIKNGAPLGANTVYSYTNALDNIGKNFQDEIAPYKSIFEIDEIEKFKEIDSKIRENKEKFKSFNRKPNESGKTIGGGKPSAVLMHYGNFLLELPKILKKDWFKEKAKYWTDVNEEEENEFRAFRGSYGPEKLKELSGEDILNTIFPYKTNKDENMCTKMNGIHEHIFGNKSKSNFSNNNGMSYDAEEGKWKFHAKECKKYEEEGLSNGEIAIRFATELKDLLVAGANEIKGKIEKSLSTPEDYNELLQRLDTMTGGSKVKRSWLQKYFVILYYHYFTTIYDDNNLIAVLKANKIIPDENPLVRMGQVSVLANEWGISNVRFGRIMNDNLKVFPRNRIFFGAPGTGKSFTLNQEKAELLKNGGECERVTFHPDYSYANFVGTYKPVPEGKNITYRYVPGPFMRTYVKAIKSGRSKNPKPCLLIIEEINRANVAAVFGDVFQLLDRKDGVSEYPIQASEDIKKHLDEEKVLDGNPKDDAVISIPSNMYIWATMNSADQGVFPMDTAFKRRWDFTYLGIDDSEGGIKGKTVILGKNENSRIVEWNKLRKAINNKLIDYNVNEDKLMGPYFITLDSMMLNDNEIDSQKFIDVFKNKVIMYLFDDAAKRNRDKLFEGCKEQYRNQYSKICKEFDTIGVEIFGKEFSEKFPDKPEPQEAADDVDTEPQDDESVQQQTAVSQASGAVPEVNA